MISIFNENTVNVFTDASCSGNFTCGGAYLVNNGDLDTRVLYGTNNEGELTGIYLGIHLLINYRNMYDPMNTKVYNLFTDSLLGVNSINNSWMKSWIKNSVDSVLMNSSARPVKNQEIIKAIYYAIIYNKLNVNIYHIHGHMNPDKLSRKDMFEFYKMNKFEISLDTLSALSKYNNLIDYKTREILLNSMYDMPEVKMYYPIIGRIDKSDFKESKKYIMKNKYTR